MILYFALQQSYCNALLIARLTLDECCWGTWSSTTWLIVGL